MPTEDMHRNVNETMNEIDRSSFENNAKVNLL